jgi:hypothetical protein
MIEIIKTVGIGLVAILVALLGTACLFAAIYFLSTTLVLQVIFWSVLFSFACYIIGVYIKEEYYL